MRERILEWHSRNPNQLAKGQLTSNANPPAAQMLLEIAPTTANTTTASYQLATTDRIAALEREILALRRGKETFDGVEVPRRAPPRPPAANPNYRAPTPPPHVSDHIPSATIHEPAAQPSQVPATASSAIAPAAPPNKAPNPTQPVVNSAPANPMPQHPYAQARDATYAPPHDRNLGAPFKAPKDKEPAYRTMAPVQDPRIAEDVFARSMKSPMLTLTPEELLSISPEVRAKYREAVTPKRTTDRITGAYIELAEEVESPEPSQIPPVSQLVVNGVRRVRESLSSPIPTKPIFAAFDQAKYPRSSPSQRNRMLLDQLKVSLTARRKSKVS
ncbi:hypothetical protein A0H81_03284 [Grifola frondosa]|uniref:Uncharacterized protein n=1 Tax=Grifola frondosa TaxID=5627 RepID=A0A1C7MJP1_GRIFR|nr:hypothetical protein A0H81_03284 [Grifola frondosa]